MAYLPQTSGHPHGRKVFSQLRSHASGHCSPAILSPCQGGQTLLARRRWCSPMGPTRLAAPETPDPARETALMWPHEICLDLRTKSCSLNGAGMDPWGRVATPSKWPNQGRSFHPPLPLRLVAPSAPAGASRFGHKSDQTRVRPCPHPYLLGLCHHEPRRGCPDFATKVTKQEWVLSPAPPPRFGPPLAHPDSGPQGS